MKPIVITAIAAAPPGWHVLTACKPRDGTWESWTEPVAGWATIEGWEATVFPLVREAHTGFQCALMVVTFEDFLVTLLPPGASAKDPDVIALLEAHKKQEEGKEGA